MGESDWSDIPMKVMPRQVRRFTGKDGAIKYAAMMPYPSLDGTQQCAGMEDLFMGEADHNRNTGKVLEASEICDSCPLITQCREWAIAHEEYGFWGGTTAAMRRTIRARRRQVLVLPHLAHVFGFNDSFFPGIRAQEVEVSRDVFVSSDDLWRMNGPE